ncbi:MAG: Fic family protein, partial [Sutterellaceae bacterium]|nr:Fic family protein [Sutterellaceae bacterium]
MRCGYSFVHQGLDLKLFPPDIPAEVSRSVNKIIVSDNSRLIPVRNAPKDESPITHLLFALRVEGINLAILSAALRKIPAPEIRAAVVEHPSSRYVRMLGFLWESFNNCELEDVNPAGPRVDLFDSSQYIVGTPVGNNKWRVAFNGLGNLDYCPTVRKTPKIVQALTDQPLKRARDWLKTIGEFNAERAMQWAYLHETKETYALERESEPSGDRRARFLSLLGKAFLQTPLTEDLLCDYQSDIVNNPYFLEFTIRQKQNWLGTGNPRNERSSMSVRYVPPSPDLLAKLMPAWLSMANSLPKTIDPIVAAACTSFGFVYLHPFLDGNGRLSRFLVHQQLAQSGELEPGMLLPISVAMQKNELSYLNALTVFSKPAREFWRVVYTGSNPLLSKIESAMEQSRPPDF